MRRAVHATYVRWCVSFCSSTSLNCERSGGLRVRSSMAALSMTAPDGAAPDSHAAEAQRLDLGRSTSNLIARHGSHCPAAC